jgi:uncharacterized protein involved in exopolysaccharide biosynthesis
VASVIERLPLVRSLPKSISRHLPLAVVVITASLIVSVLLAILLPKVYRAEALLVPTINESRMDAGVAAARNDLAGLASRFGVTVGRTTADAQAEVIATLKARSFINAFITDHDLLPTLFADKWDSAAKRWTVEPEEVPQLADGYRYFTENVLEVRSDIQTGLVTVRIEWFDPAIAAQWANELVARINALMRGKAITDANGSLEYLRKELTREQPVELQQVIYGLIENDLTQVSMAQGRAEYAFRVIDPATAPQLDEYVRPQRLLIVAVGLVFGVFLSLMLAWLRESVLIPPAAGE